MNARAEFIDNDFFTELASTEGGTKVKKVDPKFETLLDYARDQFIKAGRKQIDALLADDPKTDKFGRRVGSWFAEQGDGRFKVMFKSEGNTLELAPGKTYFFVADANKAAELIANAVMAAEARKLDSHLELKPKAAKSEPKWQSFMSTMQAAKTAKV